MNQPIFRSILDRNVIQDQLAKQTNLEQSAGSQNTQGGVHDSDQTRTSCKTFYLTQLSEKPRVKYRFLFRQAIGRTLTQMLNC